VRFLLDQNVSSKVVDLLGGAGHDAIHVRAIGMREATDAAVLDRAAAEGRVIVTGDSDFGTLLAQSRANYPSVLFLRRVQGQRSVQQAALILDNLSAVTEDLTAGALVVCTDTFIRVRRLPLIPR
jgi:predicted nuclease of predicted toxin-antitoxin system